MSVVLLFKLSSEHCFVYRQQTRLASQRGWERRRGEGRGAVGPKEWGVWMAVKIILDFQGGAVFVNGAKRIFDMNSQAHTFPGMYGIPLV